MVTAGVPLLVLPQNLKYVTLMVTAGVPLLVLPQNLTAAT